MFNQGNFKAICELARNLEPVLNESTIKDVCFKPFDKFDAATMASASFPTNLYEDGEKQFPQIGENIRLDDLLVSKVDMESVLAEKTPTNEQQLLSENLMKTWSKDR
jgi:hypothetical protein